MTTRTLRSQTINTALCAASLVATIACGADFDTQDKIKTLRVLAVQHDYPYAAPTLDPSSPSQVRMTMLSHNALPPATAETADSSGIQRLWFSGCDDLPGDQYFTCLARMSILWQLYSANPERKALVDCEQSECGHETWWSPVDDLDDTALQALLQQVNPSLPTELARPYFSTYRIGAGERFTYPIPPRIIENHRSTDPGTPPFGLAFVFFTACAGHIDLAPEWANLQLGTNLRDATLGFPFLCRSGTGTDASDGTLVPSGTGTPLDSDSFVAGYTQQFVYSDPSVNKNPVISGLTFADHTYTFDSNLALVEKKTDAGGNVRNDPVDSSVLCFNGDCVPEPPRPAQVTDCAEDAPQVKACSDHCPTYELTPTMYAELNNDIDTFTSKEGSTAGEQMWIDYYADRGEFDNSAKSVRDASLGWLAETQRQNIGDKWKPPADTGPAWLWAVVHDNRVGTAWVRLQVCVVVP